LGGNDDNLSLTTEVNKPTMLEKAVIRMHAQFQDRFQNKSQASESAVYKGGE
jgi:hypothetical protein